MTGDSGCGKTSLVKAINGLWPYGRGNIVFPEGVKTFYAAQDVKLPQRFAEGAGVPAVPPRRLFRRAGRGGASQVGPRRFHRASRRGDAREGKAWDQVLSGGQKQKLVVARILLQQPGLLFLDEATGALDPQAKIAFHQAIKDHCPRITVISIMHEARAAEIGDRRRILRQRAHASPMASPRRSRWPLNLPVELTTILAQAAAARPPALAAHPPQGKIAAQSRTVSRQAGLPQPPPLAVPIRISSPGSTIRPLTKA